MALFNKTKKLETAEDFNKESGVELLKYYGWIFAAGMAIGKAAQHYGIASNCKLISKALDMVKGGSSSSEEKTE